MRTRRRARALVPVVVLVGLLGGLGLPGCTAEPGSITETFTIGTFNLAPAGTSGSESESWTATVPRPGAGKDILVTRLRFFVTDAAGRELDLGHDGIHLHHVVMMSTKAPDSACPTSGYPAFGGQRFAASGNEKTPIILPAGYAYHVRPTDSWRALWHLMNLGSVRQDGVRLAYEITYVEGTPGDAKRDVTPYYLDVAGCTSSDFDLPGGGPAGSVATKSATMPIPTGGRAVFTLGHVHDGGIDVSLADEGGQVWCTATAAYAEGPGHDHGHGGTTGPQGSIATISACPIPFDVPAGRPWTVTARYDGAAAYKDVMGVIFTYIAASSG